jgi:hypothetical protein
MFDRRLLHMIISYDQKIIAYSKYSDVLDFTARRVDDLRRWHPPAAETLPDRLLSASDATVQRAPLGGVPRSRKSLTRQIAAFQCAGPNSRLHDLDIGCEPGDPPATKAPMRRIVARCSNTGIRQPRAPSRGARRAEVISEHGPAGLFDRLSSKSRPSSTRDRIPAGARIEDSGNWPAGMRP